MGMNYQPLPVATPGMRSPGGVLPTVGAATPHGTPQEIGGGKATAMDGSTSS